MRPATSRRAWFCLVSLTLTLAAACGGGAASSTTTANSPSSANAAVASTLASSVDLTTPIAPTTRETPAGALRFVMFDGSTVDVEDLDLVDLADWTPSGLLFLADDEIIFAGLLDDVPVVKSMTGLAAEELLSVPSPVALCGEAIVAAVRHGAEDEIVSIGIASGEERWRIPAPDPQGGHGVACGGGTAAVTEDGRHALGLSLLDGSTAWTSPVSPDDPPIADSGLAVIGTDDGVATLDLDTGRELWRAGEASDAALVVGSRGVLIDQAGVPTLYSVEGEPIATFPSLVDDVRREMGIALDYREVRIGGGEERVLALFGRRTLVGLDGRFRQAPEAVGAVAGTSHDAIWSIGSRGSVVIERLQLDGTVLDSVAVETEFDIIASTDDVMLGVVEGVPALVHVVR